MVIAVAAVILLPWLGRTHFNTKGEPREAIVATAMLSPGGDWVLPLSHGEDLPYKPPMLAWTVAAASLTFHHGVVNDYCSRLPSALALMGLVWMTYAWTARRRGPRVAALTALTTMMALEVMRSGVICRVDMLLAFFMAGAIMLLDTEGLPPGSPRRRRRVFWAVVLMALATLTKGPVGALLPALVAGLYRLACGRPFWRTFWGMTGLAVLAVVLSLPWYLAAWQRGGDAFLRLAWEENIGRLTGTMTYDSHLKPWWYPPMTLLYGLAPFTLAALLALVVPPARRRMAAYATRALPLAGRRDDMLLSVIAAAVITVFYCIPSSKRSVYLLPAYPFLAYMLVAWLCHGARRWQRGTVAFSAVMGVLALLAAAAMVALRCGAAQYFTGPLARWTSLLANGPMGWWEWVVIGACAAVAWASLRGLARRPGEAWARALASVGAMYVMYFATVQPLLLNPRSNFRDARAVEALSPDPAKSVYTFIPDDALVRYYGMNFYLGHDRLRRLEAHLPEAGALLLANPSALDSAYRLRSGLQAVPTGTTFVSADRGRDTVTVYRIISVGHHQRPERP